MVIFRLAGRSLQMAVRVTVQLPHGLSPSFELPCSSLTVREVKALLPLLFDTDPAFRSNPFLVLNFIEPGSLSLAFHSSPLPDHLILSDIVGPSPLVLSIANSLSLEPFSPDVPDSYQQILANVREITTLARMLNSGDRSVALATLGDDAHAKFLLVPPKIFTKADVDAAWSPAWRVHARHTVRINNILVHPLPNGVTVPAPGLATGFLVDLDGMPAALRGRVVMTCSHCIGFEGMNKSFAAAVHGMHLFADCPFGHWSEAETYLSITPELTKCAPSPILNRLCDHLHAAHKIVRVYMPSQDVLADIAIAVLENPVRDGDEIV